MEEKKETSRLLFSFHSLPLSSSLSLQMAGCIWFDDFTYCKDCHELKSKGTNNIIILFMFACACGLHVYLLWLSFWFKSCWQYFAYTCTCMWAIHAMLNMYMYYDWVSFEFDSLGNYCPVCGECYSDSDYDSKVWSVLCYHVVMCEL